MGDLTDDLAEGLNATPKQKPPILQALWVAGMTTVMAWMLGLFSAVGLASPFAPRALADDVATMRHTQEITAQITIGGELSKAMDARCREKDPNTIDNLSRYIESLQAEYQSITKQRYPERICR